MKLGISYMVFDGVELLEYAIKSVRSQVDFVSVVYQNVSYFGDKAEPNLEETVFRLKSNNLIDELVHYESDLTINHKINELNIRNFGLSLSKEAGCTHHISSDVDELYVSSQLEYAKEMMKNDYDYSIIPIINYYKHPTYQIFPSQQQVVSFIHSVDNMYDLTISLPFNIEITRRLKNSDNYKLFREEEVVVHHMSYVRKDIRRKLNNSSNSKFYRKLDKFIDDFNKYKLGDRVCISPDFLNRKTILVDNIFNINLRE